MRCTKIHLATAFILDAYLGASRRNDMHLGKAGPQGSLPCLLGPSVVWKGFFGEGVFYLSTGRCSIILLYCEEVIV